VGGNENKASFFGVCDGHGANGHKVSSFIKDNLPKVLDRETKRRNKVSLSKLIKEVFISVNCSLLNEAMTDTQFSGSTCASLLFFPDKVFSANVGDSRAILAKFSQNEWKSLALTRDHKPSEKDEAKRILNKKGRIEAFVDEEGEYVGPQRVWLADQNVPGLAMSRSFGDQVAAQVGVTSEPEVFEFPFGMEDRFVVIASDGVWEFISNEECVNIVKEFYDAKDVASAAEFVVEEATRRWHKEESVVDDITVIVIFLEN